MEIEIDEGLVRRVERLQGRRVESNRVSEQETEILCAWRRVGDVVATTIDGRSRRFHLRQPDATFRIAEFVANDRIGGRGIADFDGW